MSDEQPAGGSQPTQAAADSEEPEDQLQMTFWEHLDELRRRILKAFIAFVVGAGASWYFREAILLWVTTPFIRAQTAIGDVPQLNFPAPADLFLSYLKLSILAGVILALPFIFYQAWAFVAPGLYARERRYAIPFVASSTLLFVGGGYFGWRVAFPIAFQYLLSYSGDIQSADISLNLKPTIMIDRYISFVSDMLLAFGAVFELPVLVFFLSVAGIINHHHLIKFSRYFVVISFLIAAVITPPDILSQLLLAIPLCVLYVISIGVAWALGKKKTRIPL